MAKNCYLFGGSKSEGDASMKPLLGGKGANLAEMANMGVPVPPGFTLTTEVCNAFLARGGALPDEVRAEVTASLEHIENGTGRAFGDPQKPLLVSVRSGARASMPGMMDTILNLGLNDGIAEGLAAATRNPRFAYDAYRRFIAMFAGVVLEIPKDRFEHLLDEPRRRVALSMGIAVGALNTEELKQRVTDDKLSEADLREVVRRSKEIVLAETGKPFPEEPIEQLWAAIGAVFRSWNNDRAHTYRRMNGIPDAWGTACTVQAMVFGNLGDTSATGVAFTRDPRSGERRFFGEWLPNAQGEDVVAGTRTPLGISRADGGEQSLEARQPEAFAELTRIYQALEKHYRDMLDIEFTIQDSKLFMLQCRVGGRSGRAEVRTAVEMVGEGLITRDEALLRVSPHKLDELLHPTLDAEAPKIFLAKGLPAGPGAATGVVVFSADEAERRAAQGKSVILVRRETSPEDIHGMKAAVGILTARGGMTSHAAVVARVIGRCCVAGCSAASVNYENQTMTVTVYDDAGKFKETVVVKAGDVITLWVDDRAGNVYQGEVPMVPAETTPEYHVLMGWADAVRKLRVRANADKATEAVSARAFGAEGIGLCRTEHMFFDPERLTIMRQMIVADTVDEREAALDKLLPFQRSDFAAIFGAMRGLPVTIRLLDPPLHEFLPTDDEQFKQLSQLTGLTVSELRRRTSDRHEVNPMLGHRGVRLAITYPEIYAMQIRAILEAACDVAAEGVEVEPEIMIPLSLARAELDFCRAIVDRVADEVFSARGRRVPFRFGTMIELPRAALLAGELARSSEFFSFGTNDLTQTTLGLSRDDSGKFIPTYQESNILAADPFQTLDIEGVGELVRIACERGRATRPEIKLGICGEHGGDPASIAFCHQLGLAYVSCSPFRVPIARLAAAQAVLQAQKSAEKSAQDRAEKS
jgi:pyruvate, orthophosphate dikinase